LGLLLASPAPAAERATLSLETRAGLVEAPFVTPAFPSVSGFATVTTTAAALRLESLGWLSVQAPVSYVRLDFPARAQVGETALGNVELAWRRPLELRPATRLTLLAGLLVPLAQHGSEAALLNNRALALSSALSPRDSALLTPGVTGLRLEASLEHSLRAFELRARLALPVLLRISEASLPEETETDAFGLPASLDVQLAWQASSWLSPSLGVGLLAEPWRVQEPARASARGARLQFVVEPGAQARVGGRVTLGLAATVPLGGNLGGEAWSVALSSRVGF
jgi:hypothetical protein